MELTDIEVGGRVVALSTEPVSFTGEAKKAGKKVLGAAALGAGIGGMIDGGEGAAWGAAAGAVVGVAAAKIVPRKPGRGGRGHGPRVPPGPAAQRRHRRVGRERA